MRLIHKLTAWIDDFQYNHRWLAFPYAVMRKFGEDQGSNRTALLTYYAFLALFPLLFAATAGLQLVLRHDPHLQTAILTRIDNSFPLLGSQLRGNINSVGKAGVALVFSIIVAVYGARGAADAVRQTFDLFWGVPKRRRAGFPKGMFKSLGMIVAGGGALLVAAVLSSLATSLGHGPLFKIIPTLISYGLLIVGLYAVQHIGVSGNSGSKHAFWLTAFLAATGSQLLQTFGGYLMTHELHTLNTPYGVFSITLALLFWIYLQAQIWLYAVEVGVVSRQKLWPRRLF